MKHTTWRSGSTSAAAIAAGSAKPIVARPFEISSVPGSSTSQNGTASSMWAPASTVAIVDSGATARAIRTTSSGVSAPDAAGTAAANSASAARRNR